MDEERTIRPEAYKALMFNCKASAIGVILSIAEMIFTYKEMTSWSTWASLSSKLAFYAGGAIILYAILQTLMRRAKKKVKKFTRKI